MLLSFHESLHNCDWNAQNNRHIRRSKNTICVPAIPFTKEHCVSFICCISVSSFSCRWQKSHLMPQSLSVLSLQRVLMWWCLCCWNLSKTLHTCLIQIKPKPFSQIKLPHFNCSCICNHLAKCLQFLPTPICWMNPKSWFIRGILKRLSALKCRC